MEIHTYKNRRIIQHTDTHYDIEEIRIDSDGNEVWAVIFCSEDEMTPKRPIELINASKACADAWLKRDQLIEAGDRVGVMAMDTACAILDERYRSLYQQWQILGGTSDIDNLAIPFVDYDHADFLEAQAARRDIYAG
jgi:hypothetical protein